MSALLRIVRLSGPVRGRLALSVALGAGAILSALALLAVSGTLISRAALRPEVLTLMALIVATRVLAMSRSLLRYGERLSSHDLALRALARLRVRLFERLAPLVPGSLPGMRAGDALSRFVGDVEALQDLYVRALAPPLVAGVVLVATTVFLLVVLPAAAPVLAVGLLVAGVAVPAATVALARRSGLRESGARARLTTELLEITHGAPELVVAGRERDAEQRVRAADDALLRLQRRDATAQGLATALGGAVAGLTVVAVAAIGVDATAGGRLDGVLLAAVVLVALGSFEATTPLAEAARRLAACVGAAERIEEVLDATPPIVDAPDPQPLPATGALRADSITVWPTDAETPILHDVSLTVAPGARVAIVGTSGAGKTTLARALVRFADPTAGVVRVGDRDLRSVRQAEVRHAVRLVSQDAHLFTTTLRANVAIGRTGAPDADVLAALGRAGLAEWVDELPRGLGTVLGEEGVAVSGGQRRRIAIARGFLADARFLILDEPTAHLDAEGAAAFLRDLSATPDPRGMVIVSHTCRGLEGFDEIVVLERGRVVERGTPAALQAAGGAYALLAQDS
jgi:ATP-binding cassette subfamily C protein CydCD